MSANVHLACKLPRMKEARDEGDKSAARLKHCSAANSVHYVCLMQDFEKLGVFYLGKPYDQASRSLQPGWLLYDSKDLVTHAVCVGMTGSGKTGLCMGLIEEAAIDRVPAIVIDPKGDLANLLLTFPDLEGKDFKPWVNEEDGARKGLSLDDYATVQAHQWKEGLAAWGQDGERIRMLRESADFSIYTPGSQAGLPVSIIKSFAAPPQAILDDNEYLRERVSSTASSLLGLLGIEADPVKSREHILISTIFDHAWRNGQDLDLAGLIGRVQKPPVARVGVLDIEGFYPAKERFELAMAINNLLAAPGFSAWMEGEPLDVSALLRTAQGKPRVSIFSIAHLSDAERMFFVTLLLSQILAWVRTQSGTTSLRAILYMDEIFGYFPPVKNPPSKQPLLTLLKQARAYGLGCVLATQNPVDLDYKGLSNAGTWFIGRLQTERDKARVLEGLEGAASEQGSKFDKGRMEQILAGLGSRVFLLNNVHEDAPVVFQTRWTLSYLRGPLTREQIKMLMRDRKAGVSSSASPAAVVAVLDKPRPVLPAEIPQHFVPGRESGDTVTYAPMILGAATVRYLDAKKNIDSVDEVSVLAPVSGAAVAVDWDAATPLDCTLDDLEAEPADGAAFDDLPGAAAQAKSYAAWNKEFSAWLFRTRKLELLSAPELDAISEPGESERDFRARLEQASREERDAQAGQLRKKYSPKITALQEKVRKAGQNVEKQSSESTQSKIQAVLSVGASVLGAFLGRKTISVTNIGKAATAIKSAGKVLKESQDVGQAAETVEALHEQLAALEAEFKAESEAVVNRLDPLAVPLEPVLIRPAKTNIAVKLLALAWTPRA